MIRVDEIISFIEERNVPIHSTPKETLIMFEALWIVNESNVKELVNYFKNK